MARALTLGSIRRAIEGDAPLWLGYIYMLVPQSISLTKNAQYCIVCFAETVTRFFENDKTYYRCQTCGAVNARSLVIDDRIVSWRDEDGRYWHESVGVIIKNNQNKIFCLLRKIYPFAYALPAGHLDVGESAAGAAERELMEETQIEVNSLIDLGRFAIHGDECRRGCDDHVWNLFLFHQPDNLKPQLSDEASSWEWLSADEILSRDDVTYPLKYIVQHYEAAIFS